MVLSFNHQFLAAIPVDNRVTVVFAPWCPRHLLDRGVLERLPVTLRGPLLPISVVILHLPIVRDRNNPAVKAVTLNLDSLRIGVCLTAVVKRALGQFASSASLLDDFLRKLARVDGASSSIFEKSSPIPIVCVTCSTAMGTFHGEVTASRCVVLVKTRCARSE